MKAYFCSFLALVLLLDGMAALKKDEYIAALDALLLDEQFVDEYRQWTKKLLSDPYYLYPKRPGDPFNCSIPGPTARSDPITVHTLRPGDVQCVAAIGDSLTAALGAYAATPIGLFTEYRGVSWSIGGDYSFNSSVTLPNILRLYNPKLKGFSTKQSLIFGKGQNSSNNALNAAESGDVAGNMPAQAAIIYQRMKEDDYCDLQKDWKVITLFVGGNDLCLFCQDLEGFSPQSYLANITKTLNFFQANFPRTFVNLVLVLDARNVQAMNEGSRVCALLHKNTCPCAAYPPDNATIHNLTEYFYQYHQLLVDLVNSGVYDSRDDFTVVVQPFMANTTLPLTPNGTIDYSYFAPDCFHFSAKGHHRAALALWNNMLEPVGEKLWEWHPEEHFQCPTEERPYFATSKNSPKSAERFFI